MKVEIGMTGQWVNRVGLGSMALAYPGRPGEKDAVSLLQQVAQTGAIYIDTANVYCSDPSEVGYCERLLAKAFAHNPELKANALIGTKGGLIKTPTGLQVNASPLALERACEQSLTDLRADSIFLYFLHTFDDHADFLESVWALKKLQDRGCVQHIGLSNVTPHQVEQALEICRIEAVQNKLNPFKKDDLENGMIELCQSRRLTYMAYSPFGGTFCAIGHKELAAHPSIVTVADRHNASPYQVMLSWLGSFGDCILPIPSARSLEHAIDSLFCLLKLSSEDQKLLDQITDRPEQTGWLTARIRARLPEGGRIRRKLLHRHSARREVTEA